MTKASMTTAAQVVWSSGGGETAVVGLQRGDLGDEHVGTHVADEVDDALHHLVGADDRLVPETQEAHVGDAEVAACLTRFLVLLLGVGLALLLHNRGVLLVLVLVQLLPEPLVVGGAAVGENGHRGLVAVLDVVAHGADGVGAIVGVGVDAQKLKLLPGLHPEHESYPP